eukprot:TRINITY_DN7308_c0_g1_i1.p1 TRINITY_DN7308_c0_g1~~TRINITY_DN7308_c0_g1_i1.p1  ORF type:complete len:105 (-),score=5.95 TRINITY_DN7308_c0_g1_i1:247-561(-)
METDSSFFIKKKKKERKKERKNKKKYNNCGDLKKRRCCKNEGENGRGEGLIKKEQNTTSNKVGYSPPCLPCIFPSVDVGFMVCVRIHSFFFFFFFFLTNHQSTR